MTVFFKELFEYSHHYNQKLFCEFIKQPELIPEQALRLFNHIINAHQIWNNRILFQGKLVGVWDVHHTQDLQVMDNTNFHRSLHLLDTIALESTVNYSNSKGAHFQNSVRDVFYHIINHSSYHRAQIATLFKQGGLEPINTDYIFFKRNSL